VVFKDGNVEKIWVIGGATVSGRSNAVWNSADGKTWTQVRRSGAAGGFGTRSVHTSVVFDDRSGEGEKIWVIGGIETRKEGTASNNYPLDDVWSSDDGVTWNEETKDSSAKFSARLGHSSVVFNDGSGEKIWVFGGTDNNSSVLDDVWSSTDGKTWTEETKDSSKKFSARHGHQSVVFDNKMWVFGGNTDAVGFVTVNDVWSSTDGKNWTKIRGNGDANGFTARYQGASVLFEKKVWLIGGTNKDGHRNDVWSMVKD
jgi:dihydrofolate reductase